MTIRTARAADKGRQLDLLSPIEPRQLPRWGWWTLNRRASNSNALGQRAYRLDQLEYVLTHIRKDVDSYMSQGFFTEPNRRALNLAYATHAYVDLDTYRSPALAGLTHGQIAWQIVMYCRDEGIPLPSVIVSSGRGLYAKWMWTSPIPKAAAGRAVAVNRALVSRFGEFGADPKAVDMSRILRIVGTVNSKTGTVARLEWINEVGGAIVTYDFGEFADEVLPFTLDTIRGFRQAAKERAQLVVLDHEKRRREAAAQRSGSTAVCWEDWHWKVLCDIERLAKLRYPQGIVQPGMLDHFGFVGAVQLAHVLPGGNALWHEVLAWGRKILPPDYLSGPYHRHCSTLLDRARRAAAGEKVEYKGRMVSPVYTYSKDKLIDVLEVQSHEMPEMLALIDTDEKRRRDREAWRAAHTGQTREEYLTANSVSRDRPWEAEGISRRTWYRRQKAQESST